MKSIALALTTLISIVCSSLHAAEYTATTKPNITNKDDLVTLEEYQIGQKNRKGLEAGFKAYDKNGDGKLIREEYVDPRAK